MGKLVKNIGATALNAVGLGKAQKVQNSTGIDLKFGQQIKDRNALNPASAYDQQQMALNQQLMNQAQGIGPSVAGMQLQQATDQNIAQQQALAASARGGNVGMAQRIASQQAGQIQQQSAQQMGLLRLQEQQAAQGLLNTGINQGGSMALNNQDGKDKFNMGLTAAAFDRDKEDVAAGQASGKAFAEFISNMGGGGMKAATTGGAPGGAAAPGGAGGAAGGAQVAGASNAAMFMSDENLKKDIKPGDKEITSFLDAMKAHSYKYKDEKHGEGKKVSPMAQELEKTSLGKSMVKEGPDGKMVDYGAGFGAMMAAMASLNQRTKELEGKKGK